MYTPSVGVLKALNTFDKFYTFPPILKKFTYFFQKIPSIVGAKTHKLFSSINIVHPFVFACFKRPNKLPESSSHGKTIEQYRRKINK